MKSHFLLIISILLFQNVFGQYKIPIGNLKLEWELYELENGLRVLLQPDTSAQDISIELWTDTGARHEITGRYGMAHFFEHATPYGLSTKDEKRKTLLDNLTGSNAQVQMDFTTYYLETTASYLPLAIEYMADRFKADPNDYIINRRTEYHRENVLAEINRNSKSPIYGVASRTARYSGIFGKHHPYGHGAYGYVEDNEKVTTDELRRWYRANFRPEYGTLFIVGNFDLSSTKKHIEEQFAALNGGKRIQEIERRPVITLGGNKMLSSDYDGYYLTFSWAVPHWNSEEAIRLELASRIMENRLSTIAEKDSILEDAGSLDQTDFFQLSGYFGVHASYKSPQSKEYVKNILKMEIDKFITHGIEEIELERAKAEAFESIQKQLSKLGFIGSRTRLLGTSLFFSGDPNAYWRRLKNQLESTKSDVDTVIKSQLAKPFFELLIIPADLTKE